MKFLSPIIATLMLLISSTSFAADAPIYSHETKGALRGADVVAYYSLEAGAKAVDGKQKYSHEYKGATWYFSTAANRDLFIAEPSKYVPAFGGYCAFAVSHGFTKSIQPDRWHIVDGTLYLNFNRIADYRWNKDRDAAIIRGNNNWPTALTACEQHDTCNTN